VIGLYGVPGSGKSFILNQLKHELDKKKFDLYEGSKAIDDVVPGGLAAFQSGTDDQKAVFRQLAIRMIKLTCTLNGRAGVVSGHYMFWPEGEAAGTPVDTAGDWSTYTHLLYLDNPAEIIVRRRKNDSERFWPSVSVVHVRRWQEAEKAALRQICLHHGILFLPISTEGSDVLYKVSNLLGDFQSLTEETNLFRALSRLEEIVVRNGGQIETMLLINGERTFTTEDTGRLFWEMVYDSREAKTVDLSKRLFSSPLGYSFTAFRQAALLNEEMTSEQEFDDICEAVAGKVEPHQEFISLLEAAASNPHVGAAVVTCGLHRIWEKILKRAGLIDIVPVIGGGRLADGLVITPAVKEALVSWLQDQHNICVWAFGDSPLDLPMLSRADQAVVVVGEESKRSKTMDAELYSSGLQARQTLIPATARPRLNTIDLPVIDLTDPEAMASVVQRTGPTGIQLIHSTDKPAAKLPTTPTRDAQVAGSFLRDAHHRVGHTSRPSPSPPPSGSKSTRSRTCRAARPRATACATRRARSSSGSCAAASPWRSASAPPSRSRGSPSSGGRRRSARSSCAGCAACCSWTRW
jgi:adenylate kinase/phosphoserine phosphatase